MMRWSPQCEREGIFNSAPDVISGMGKTIGLYDSDYSILFLPMIHSVLFSLLL